jgi:hypothetical protein
MTEVIVMRRISTVGLILAMWPLGRIVGTGADCSVHPCERRILAAHRCEQLRMVRRAAGPVVGVFALLIALPWSLMLLLLDDSGPLASGLLLCTGMVINATIMMHPFFRTGRKRQK